MTGRGRRTAFPVQVRVDPKIARAAAEARIAGELYGDVPLVNGRQTIVAAVWRSETRQGRLEAAWAARIAAHRAAGLEVPE